MGAPRSPSGGHAPRALLLAAGEGTRLRPLTADRPKPMLPVAGKPLLAHLVELLRQHGITELAINLHYCPTVITDYFGDGRQFGVQITYSYEPTLLGTAGAARQLAWFFDRTFLVLYGDVLTDLNLTALLEWHRAHEARATLALYEVDDPTRCGIVELDADDRITRFVEKPAAAAGLGRLANAGAYVLEPAVLAAVPPGRPCDFGRDVFPALLARGAALYGYRTDSYVLDIGSPERYTQANADLSAGRCQPAVGPRAYRWFVARTRPRAERLAAMAVEGRGLRTYLPEWRRRRRGGEEREALFPGYLFVRSDNRDDALLRARSAPNVLYLLGDEAGPQPVPDALVAEVRERCEQRARAPFARGQKVRIARGPFRELDAIFDRACSGGARARVFIELLSRLVPVTLEMNALRYAI
ncbi:MAG TPA: sugar phosphate nucleotidyltransferase [Chloroflexota bacterium]|nr:sugar phosphate nucleotidyltransferase [Chloroflexota bacterium]